MVLMSQLLLLKVQNRQMLSFSGLINGVVYFLSFPPCYTDRFLRVVTSYKVVSSYRLYPSCMAMARSVQMLQSHLPVPDSVARFSDLPAVSVSNQWSAELPGLKNFYFFSFVIWQIFNYFCHTLLYLAQFIMLLNHRSLLIFKSFIEAQQTVEQLLCIHTCCSS